MAINQLSDELKEKLPPTDCRFRPDLRYFENGDLQNAEAEKDRLESNQEKRRQAAKKLVLE